MKKSRKQSQSQEVIYLIIISRTGSMKKSRKQSQEVIYLIIISRTGSMKKSRKQSQSQEVVAKGTIKYNAQKLYEKGLVLMLDGIPPSQ